MDEKSPTKIPVQPTRPAPKRNVTGEAPPLAHFIGIAEYVPEVGDFLVWAGLLTTWYGVVVSVTEDGQTFEAAFQGLPTLLFTMTPEEIDKNTRVIPIYKVRGSRSGSWSAMKHDKAHNTPIWFI